MKTILLGGIAAAVLSTVAIAQTPAPPAARQHAAKVQTRADVTSRVQRHFGRVDANRDNVITQAEVQALQARNGERQARRADRQTGRDPATAFQRLDANSDGQVTRAEFDARRSARAPNQAQASQRGEQRFARLDADRNGAISQAEFAAGRQLREQRGSQRAERSKRRDGANGGRFGGQMFTMADANKDGRVTLQEAQSAALRHFDMADANRDGQVTGDERRQMRRNMRQQGGHAGHQG